MSKTTDPADKQMMRESGYSGAPYSWVGCIKVAIVAGQKCYIEAFHQLGDSPYCHFSVAWAFEGDKKAAHFETRVIPSNMLTPYDPSTKPPDTATTRAPVSATRGPPFRALFSTIATLK